MTAREARRRCGSRKNRRANMNGKTLGSTTGGRATKRRYPRKDKNMNRVKARKLREGKLA